MRRITLGQLSFASGERLVVALVLLVVWSVRLFFQKRSVLPFWYVALLPDEAKEPQRIWILEKVCIGWIILVAWCVLAQPQSIDRWERISKSWIDIVLALDISQSMLADDFQPNRLDVAKEVIDGFLDELESDRVSMVVFAGKPFVSVPLTFDYQIFKDILQRTTIDTINQQVQWLQWTAIGDALLSSLTILEKWREDIEDDEEREQVVVLLTDWVANTWIQPLVVWKAAYEQAVKVYTVWIGSEQWWYISYDTPFGMRRQRIEWVDETTLQQLAAETWWRYWRATDKQTFERIFDELQTLEQHDIESEEKVLYSDMQEWFLLILVLLWWVLLWLYMAWRQVDDI